MVRDTTNHIEIVAYSKALSRQRQVAGLRAVDVQLSLNAVSSGTFEVDADDSINAVLQTAGTRVVLNYRGRQELSGPVRKQGLGLQPTDRQVYTIEDDWRHMPNTDAWVVPVAAYTSQGKLDAQSLTDDAQAISTVAHDAGTNAGYGAFVFPTGTGGSISSETAIKTLIQRNIVDRLGAAWQAARGTSYVPVVVAADQQRGGDAGVAGKLPVPRFESLADNLAALLAWSGLRLFTYQETGASGNRIVFDVATAPTYPQKITLASGILVDGDGSISGPNATRIAVGGPGDVTARDWHEVLDATGREALWGDIIEVVKDAGSAPITWPASVSAALQVPKYYRLRPEVTDAAKATYLAALNAAGAEGLADGAPKTGLGLTLAETETFSYGGVSTAATPRTPVVLGMNLNVELAARVAGAEPPTMISQVTGAHIVLDADTGVTTTVTVGERTDDPDAELARALASVQTALRRRASRK